MGNFSISKTDSCIIVENNEKFTVITDMDAIGPFNTKEADELMEILKVIRKMTKDESEQVFKILGKQLNK